MNPYFFINNNKFLNIVITSFYYNINKRDRVIYLILFNKS